MNRFVKTAFAFTVCTFFVTASASAQATRTWVSGVGDDANPCSRTAPCKTFAGAISKTAPGGEISVLDPGGFGAVTITKSITLNGEGTLAGILAAGTNGIIINVGASDVVIIRNISIVGANTGLNGIRMLSGGRLVVDRCAITGFTQAAIEVSPSADADVTVTGSSMHSGSVAQEAGFRIESTGSRVDATLRDVTITGVNNGVDTRAASSFVTVSDSTIRNNSNIGVWAEAGGISVNRSVLSSNGIAVQAQTGATVRISGNDVYDNLTGFGCGGGTLASTGDNRKGNNSGGGPACSPGTTITVQ